MTSHNYLFSAVVIVSASAFASDVRGQTGVGRVDPAIAAGIRAGDRVSLQAAAASLEPAYLPLVQQLRSTSHARALDGDIVTALAALGDTQTQQEIWCAAVAETVVPDLSGFQVGGFFAIRSLDRIVRGAGEAAYWRAARREKPSDELPSEPKYRAVRSLQQIFRRLPQVGAPSAGSARTPMDDVEQWTVWLDAHREELRGLQPTGDGVEYTEAACQR